MKTIFLSLLFASFLLCNQAVFGQLPPNKQNNCFKPGEVLKYEMGYGFIKAGEASLTLKKVKFKGKDAYYVKAVGRTLGVTHSIYKVKDVYESYFNPTNCKPYKSLMNLKEGSYRNYNEVYYNHSSGLLISKKTGKKKMEQSELYDIVSAFYKLRNNLNNLKVNQKVTIHTYFHDEPWDLVVRFKGYQTIKTSLGKIRCMKFKPIVIEGTFESEDALDIWISADENRIPIRVKMKLWVGSFKVDLKSYTGLANPISFSK